MSDNNKSYDKKMYIIGIIGTVVTVLALLFGNEIVIKIIDFFNKDNDSTTTSVISSDNDITTAVESTSDTDTDLTSAPDINIASNTKDSLQSGNEEKSTSSEYDTTRISEVESMTSELTRQTSTTATSATIASPISTTAVPAIVISSTSTTAYPNSDTSKISSSKENSSINTSTLSSDTEETSNTLISADYKPLKINYYPQEHIEAWISENKVHIKVSKHLSAIEGVVNTFPFSWSISIGSYAEEEKKGYQFINLEISIDQRYNVMKSQMVIYEMLDKGFLVVEKCNNIINATFDGDYYYIEGDISNDYIDMSNLWVRSVYYD